MASYALMYIVEDTISQTVILDCSIMKMTSAKMFLEKISVFATNSTTLYSLVHFKYMANYQPARTSFTVHIQRINYCLIGKHFLTVIKL